MRQDNIDNDNENVVNEIDQDIVDSFARQLDEVVHIQEDESDEEDQVLFGYQPLSQDDNEDEQEDYAQLESDDEQMDMTEPPRIELEESNRLAPETSDLIKSIMSNIQLSNEAIPEWAKKIPEDAWLPRVTSKDNNNQ